MKADLYLKPPSFDLKEKEFSPLLENIASFFLAYNTPKRNT